MAVCTAWSFRGFSCCLKCSKLWNCESSDRRTKESNLFCFIGPRYICLPSNYGKSLNYQVAPAKTGLIWRGENHSLSWQFLHMRDRIRVGSRQRSLLLRFPAQIETSASREPLGLHFVRFLKQIFGCTAFTLYFRYTESSVVKYLHGMFHGQKFKTFALSRCEL
jgi:hypothetical protein